MRQLSLAVILWVVAAASPAFAQYTLTTLASFNGANVSGAVSGVVLSPDGSSLYGTTQFGGAYDDGVVYSVPVTGGTPAVLASFNGTDGSQPLNESGLVLSGGVLYGTTEYGGANGYGEVFSVPVTGGTPNVLYSFGSFPSSKYPVSGLILSGSTLYGTTEGTGLAGGYGTVFAEPVTGGSANFLTGFGETDGDPDSGLTLSGGILYGTTAYGGYDYGIVYSVSADGSPSPRVLANFDDADGYAPVSRLVLSGDTLYGTTDLGGDNYGGVVFSLPVVGGTPTVLASFSDADTVNGQDPQGDLLLSGSTLFGTAAVAGADDDGVVYSVPLTGGTPTVLASFDGTNGATPVSGLIMDSDGNFYGTASEGGDVEGDGTVFELSVPEPTSASLFAIGLLTLLRRTRRRVAG